MIADRGRLRVMLADTARTLHVGVLADCFFDPANAVCLRHAAGNRSAPMISLCEPSRCPNACITARHRRSEEHTSELQSLMRISYAVFCLKKKKKKEQDKASTIHILKTQNK